MPDFCIDRPGLQCISTTLAGARWQRKLQGPHSTYGKVNVLIPGACGATAADSATRASLLRSIVTGNECARTMYTLVSRIVALSDPAMINLFQRHKIHAISSKQDAFRCGVRVCVSGATGEMNIVLREHAYRRCGLEGGKIGSGYRLKPSYEVKIDLRGRFLTNEKYRKRVLECLGRIDTEMKFTMFAEEGHVVGELDTVAERVRTEVSEPCTRGPITLPIISDDGHLGQTRKTEVVEVAKESTSTNSPDVANSAIMDIDNHTDNHGDVEVDDGMHVSRSLDTDETTCGRDGTIAGTPSRMTSLLCLFEVVGLLMLADNDALESLTEDVPLTGSEAPAMYTSVASTAALSGPALVALVERASHALGEAADAPWVAVTVWRLGVQATFNGDFLTEAPQPDGTHMVVAHRGGRLDIVTTAY